MYFSGFTKSAPFKVRKSPLSYLSAAGFTLVEVMVSTAVVAVFMTGMFALNSQALKVLRSSQGVISAEESNRGRLDKMRNAPFDAMLDPSYISGTVLASAGNTFPSLDGLTIVIQVSAYPLPASASTAAPTVIVTRNSSGTVTVTKAGDGTLDNEKIVMITTTSTWTQDGKTRTHQSYTLANKNGISGRND
jgi:prepilin-type N-terminal cleavage/methylation domain-containing protein